MKKCFACVVLLLGCVCAFGQSYSFDRKFDGVHKNEIITDITAGHNVITGMFVGQAAFFTHHFTDRWSISGGEQYQFMKNVGSLDFWGTYRLPLKRTNLYFDAHLVDNMFYPWQTNEFIANASAYFEGNYMDFRFGMSFIMYHKYDVKEEYYFTDRSYIEPPTLIVGLGVNIRPRNHPWNVGFFIRNYDQFFYENWNINLGMRANARINDQLKIISELTARPAGSMSQLATRYEVSYNLGVKYVW